MDLTSPLARKLINRLNVVEHVSFRDLLAVILEDHTELFISNRLFVNIDQNQKYISGLYLEKLATFYTQEQVINYFIEFNELSLKLKKGLQILDYLVSNYHLTSYRAQPDFAVGNIGAIFYYGNMNTQFSIFFGFVDPELLSLLYSNFSVAYSINESLRLIIRHGFLDKDDYRFNRNLTYNTIGIWAAALALLFSGISSCLAYQDLNNTEIIKINDPQFKLIESYFENINRNIDSLK